MLLKWILIALIKICRPFFDAGFCCFIPTCSKYAIEQLQTKPLFRALYAIIIRLCSCFNLPTIR